MLNNPKSPVSAPVFLLALASVGSLSPVAANIVLTRGLGGAYLIWNLFLAWLPLLFAVLACGHFRLGDRLGWRFWSASGAWLLFFPNAPYIFTDLVHLHTWHREHYWPAWSVILMCAVTGLAVGFVSLYLMQSLVTRRFGPVRGWLFVAAVAGMSGVGIYLGRFLRVNSWDVVAHPVEVFGSLGQFAAQAATDVNALAFAVLASLFLFTTYLALCALTHLPANLLENSK
ncbi:MAG: hypothetical protein RL380_1809 [Verrucomicrobiota bacterium]